MTSSTAVVLSFLVAAMFLFFLRNQRRRPRRAVLRLTPSAPPPLYLIKSPAPVVNSAPRARDAALSDWIERTPVRRPGRRLTALLPSPAPLVDAGGPPRLPPTPIALLVGSPLQGLDDEAMLALLSEPLLTVDKLPGADRDLGLPRGRKDTQEIPEDALDHLRIDCTGVHDQLGAVQTVVDEDAVTGRYDGRAEILRGVFRNLPIVSQGADR